MTKEEPEWDGRRVVSIYFAPCYAPGPGLREAQPPPHPDSGIHCFLLPTPGGLMSPAGQATPFRVQTLWTGLWFSSILVGFC